MRRRRLGLLAATSAAVLALDQATKTWALGALDDGPVHLFWTLRLSLSFNSGAAFGLGRGVAPLMVAAGVIVLAVLLFSARAVTGTLPTLAVGLVAGGAVGNLTDRLVRDHGGAVVDFVDLGWWPVFNVADAAITCGAVLLVLTARRERPEAA